MDLVFRGGSQSCAREVNFGHAMSGGFITRAERPGAVMGRMPMPYYRPASVVESGDQLLPVRV